MPPQFGDVGPALRVEHEMRRALGVCPLAEILTVRAEDLDAVVLAIADEDAPVGRHGDTVRDEELAGAAARCAPRPLQLA